MTKITGKPRKPQDATVSRNVRASQNRDHALAARIAALEKRIAMIEQALRGKG